MSRHAPKWGRSGARSARRDPGQQRPGHDMPLDLLLAVLDVVEQELGEEGPAALQAEHVTRAELKRIRSLR